MLHQDPGQIALVGSSHRVAPVHVRDALFPTQERVSAFYEAVERGELGVDGAVVLSTCSRFEVYALAANASAAAESVKKWFFDEASEIAGHIYVRTDDDAVLHLHSVAAGLDSIMLGEHEILGQLKDSLERASEGGTAGPIMEQLFQSAIKAGRRARAETAIGRGGTSIAYAAANIAQEVVPSDERRTVVIVGAGKTASLVARHFHQAGWSDLVVVNRTLSRAEALAEEYGGRAFPLARLTEAMNGADALVAAVHSDGPVVLAELFATTKKNGRPLVALDLGNPRNIDPGVRDSDCVCLRDLDDLRAKAEANHSRRSQDIPAVTEIVEYEADRFTVWLAHRAVVPMVKHLRESFTFIAEAELAKHSRHFQEQDQAALERFTNSLLKKLLHQPITHLKEMSEAAQGHGDRISALQEIFEAAGWGTPALNDTDT